MYAVLVSIGLLASLLGADAACQPYDASTYNCLNGQYLCSKPNCACPHLTDSGYDCYSLVPTSTSPGYRCPAGGGLTDNKAVDNSRGFCPATSGGDPLVRGFDGCEWYLQGEPQTVVNLVSEAKHVVNTLLVPANLTDADHNNDGTFHGAISVRYQDAVVVASVDPQGRLSVTLDGEPVPFEAVREQHGLTVEPKEFSPYYGQVVEITTPAFRFFVHAVQPYTDASGWNRGHLDFKAEVTAADLYLHGLLGQTHGAAASVCFYDYKFHGKGSEEDYLVPELDSVDFVYSLFGKPQATRRLKTAGDFYVPLAHPIAAGSAKLLART